MSRVTGAFQGKATTGMCCYSGHKQGVDDILMSLGSDDDKDK